jgi:nucleoside 2-deoxyribosyltransferase
MTKAFIAGPLFNLAQLIMLEKIAAELESINIKTFLPHRDVGLLWTDNKNIPSEAKTLEVFKKDYAAVLECEIFIAWIDDIDTGTSIELGIAYENKIPIFALHTDPRPYVNPMMIGICNEGKNIFPSIGSLTQAVKEFLKKDT